MTEQSPNQSSRSGLGRQPVWVKELGITTLYEPENQPPVADVVFVHGLQGHPWRTWRYKGNITTRVPLQEPETHRFPSIFKRPTPIWEKTTQFGRVYWPAELLPHDQKDVRILTYGYDSRVTKWFSGASNQMNIEQHGASFLNSLVAERNTSRGCPIIFIVHSLGGLVLKEAIRKSRAEGYHLHLRDLYDSIRGIIFFGTPHRGSKDAGWGMMLRNIANAALFDTNDSVLRDLEPHSGFEKLNQLSSTLGEVLNERDVCITTFQESKGKAGNLLLNSKVVSDESSALRMEKFEIIDSINANHMSMCRFSGPDDDGYDKAKKALSFHVDRIKACCGTENKVSSVMSLPLRSSEKPLGENSTTSLREKSDVDFDRHLSAEVSKSLYYQDINNRRNHIYEDKLESYSWIWCSTDSSSCFTKWLSDGRGVFWITGRPGSGKSTLVKYLMNHSKTKQYLTLSRHDQDWRIISFFFDFRAGKGFANNFEGLLRSLLLQITHEEPEILAIIQSYGIEDFDPELRLKWSVPTLRSALQTALTKSTSNICIFVDGLDEYEGSYRDLVDLFKDVESLLGTNERPRVKVCLASRPEPVLLVLLNESTGFKMQDCNASSISLCVSRRLEPILKTEADSEVNRLGKRISEMAEGIFLWAILAIDDVIEQWAYGTPFLEIETGLQSLPTDLDAMYARILGRIKGKHRQEGSLMLYLVCYAAHTITVEQLYTAVSISMAESDVSIERPNVKIISSFTRRVSAYTCGLLDVTYRPTREPWRNLGSMLLSVDSKQTRPDNSIGKGDVKPLHETVRTFLERSTTARSFFMDETTCQYRATELWLRVCSRYFEISGTIFRTRGITPDLEWIRDSSYRFPLHQYMRKSLGYHAHMFENDSEQSSYSLLDPILTQENIDLFDLGDQLDEGTSSLTPLSFAAGHGLALFCRDKIVAGADVNEYGGRAFLTATANAHERTVRMLLEHGALLTKKHLYKILQNLSLQIIKEIWSRQGASRQNEDQEPFKVLSLLYSVVASDAVNFDDLIVFFSRNGEDVNVCAGPHGTPLHALLCKPPRMLVAKKMRVLIQNGADVNADGPEGKPLDLILEKSKTVDHLYLVETIRRIELLIVNGAISDHADEDVIHRMRVLVNKFDKFRNSDEAQNLKQRSMDYIDKLLSRKPAEFNEEGL